MRTTSRVRGNIRELEGSLIRLIAYASLTGKQISLPLAQDVLRNILDRDDPKFFDNSAHLFVVRTDWRFLKNWETVAEGRVLEMPDLDERRSGALLGVYRYLGENLKVGVGYNFTDFSDDLTDLSYDHHGVFFNLVGSL